MNCLVELFPNDSPPPILPLTASFDLSANNLSSPHLHIWGVKKKVAGALPEQAADGAGERPHPPPPRLCVCVCVVRACMRVCLFYLSCDCSLAPLVTKSSHVG